VGPSALAEPNPLGYVPFVLGGRRNVGAGGRVRWCVSLGEALRWPGFRGSRGEIFEDGLTPYLNKEPS
jgi:hypothetical protein